MEKKPFKPFVTVEEAAAYRKDKPETWTKSLFLNALMDALEVVKSNSPRQIAEYMDIEPVMINQGVKIVTGMTYTDFRMAVTRLKIKQIWEKRPDIDGEELASMFNYSPSGISRLKPDYEAKHKARMEEKERFLKMLAEIKKHRDVEVW